MIRLCSPHCGLEPGSTSGGAVYDRELLSALARTVDVHLPTPTRAVPAILAPRLEPVWPPIGWRWWYAAPLVARAVGRCWARHRFDVLRAHSARYVGPGCLLARPSVPLVVHHHHFDGIWQERVDWEVLRRADLVTTDSEWSADVLDLAGIRPVLVVPAGVGREFLEAEGRREGYRILFLGALKDRKNPLALPRILRAVLDRGPWAELTVVGDGPRRHEMEARARTLRLDRAITFMGYVHDQGRPRYYADADLFVWPSRLEGFGMTVLEAMATGLPVVCSAVGSLPELVRDGWNGFLVKDPDDHAGFADRIVELLRHPALRAEMGHRARVAAARYSWPRSADILRTALEGLT